VTLTAKNLDPDFNIGPVFAFDWLAISPTTHRFGLGSRLTITDGTTHDQMKDIL
jgi:hypothetical protein